MKTVIMLALCVAVAAFPTALLAQAETAPADAAAVGPPAEAGKSLTVWQAVAIVGTCLTVGLTVAAGSWGISRIGSSMLESVARQPEAAGAMFAPMVIAAAMIEGGMLFGILICMLSVLRV